MPRTTPPRSHPATRRTLLRALAAALLLPVVRPLVAQAHESALSEGEVEKLRDTAYYPPERVLAFIAFLDQRTNEIDRLGKGTRRPGREQDIDDQMQQFASIADDLDDNLDEYDKHHRDIRKVLPKLVAATERWGTALKTPPEHPVYTLARKLALESLNDVHQSAMELIESQKTWFLAHPPAKEDGKAPHS